MPLISILFSLSITLLIETGIYMILKHRDLKLLLIVSLLNLVLNPAMNLIIFYFAKDEVTYWVILSIYEVMTTLVESLVIFLLMKFKYLKTLLFAVLANASSFLIGLLLRPVYETKTTVIVLTLLFFLGYLFIYLFDLISFVHTNHDNDRDNDERANQ